MTHALMLYDGHCGFCNGTVRWMIARDRHDRFRFAPQQSALAAAVLSRHGVNREQMLDTNSVYLVLNYGCRDERLLSRSDVAVHVLLRLGGVWRIAGWLFQAVPKPLRDTAYDFVARNRFRISGRYQTCPLPTAAQRSKFLNPAAAHLPD